MKLMRVRRQSLLSSFCFRVRNLINVMKAQLLLCRKKPTKNNKQNPSQSHNPPLARVVETGCPSGRGHGTTPHHLIASRSAGILMYTFLLRDPHSRLAPNILLISRRTLPAQACPISPTMVAFSCRVRMCLFGSYFGLQGPRNN